MLSAQTLNRMRSIQEDFLPDTANIKARVSSGDGKSGKLESWPVSQTNVPCRIVEMDKERRVKWADKLGTQAGWIVTMAHDQEVSVNDKLVIGGVDYTVLGTNADESWQTALRLYCARVK